MIHWSAAEIEAFFYQKIPLAQTMGVRVASFEPGELTLSAPLTLNHNHLGTAFGGSLSALATLTGYGLLWLELEDPSAHIVIQRSLIEFKRPVETDLRAVCRAPSHQVLQDFKREFDRKGKARLELTVLLFNQDSLAVHFVGTFVALRPKP